MTDEVAVEPHPTDPGRFAWRLSVATVEVAGPFSTFPGVDRTLMLVEGPGMELRIGDAPWTRIDRPFAPVSFPGEAPVQCRLIDGPVRDFNAMVDRTMASAVLTVIDGAGREAAIESSASRSVETNVVLAFGGAVEARVGEDPWTLGPMDALRVDDDRPLTIVARRPAFAVVVRLSRR